MSCPESDALALYDRATLEPLDHKPLLRIGAVDVTSGDLRAYATLLWVGKAAIIGYVTVSITQRGGPGGVCPQLCAALAAGLRCIMLRAQGDVYQPQTCQAQMLIPC